MIGVDSNARARTRAWSVSAFEISTGLTFARVILFNLCGHGHFDLSAYERYLSGQLEDYEYPAEKVKEALEALAGLPIG